MYKYNHDMLEPAHLWLSQSSVVQFYVGILFWVIYSFVCDKQNREKCNK